MKRILYLDLVRGFTVLFMPAVHTVLLYSNPDVQTTLLGQFLAFIAEQIGASVLMFAMGVSIARSTTLTAKRAFVRSALLLVTGYGLNIWKFYLPGQLGILPPSLLEQFPQGISGLILMGDIFHFAGIAYLLLYSVNICRYSLTVSLVFIGFIILGHDYYQNLSSNRLPINFLLHLLTGGPPFVYFPVLPWLLFPLLGIVVTKINFCFQSVPIWKGVTFSTLLLFLVPWRHSFHHFYQPDSKELLHLSRTLLIWIFIATHVARVERFQGIFKVLQYCSRRISIIYIVQWLLIMWLLPVAGFQCLDVIESIAWIIIVTALTFILTVIITYETTFKNLRYHWHRNRTI